MKRLLKICLATVMVLAATAPTQADDIFPPPWLGQDRTLYAGWDTWGFGLIAPGDPIAPDYWDSNPSLGDSPEGYTDVGATYLSEYTSSTGGGKRYDVIELTDDFALYAWLPNFPPDDRKHVWVQITYAPTDWDPVNETYTQVPLLGYYTPGGENVENLHFVDVSLHGDGWVTEAYAFDIVPNPEEEILALGFQNFAGSSMYPGYVDQIVIDTICVPEPATAALLSLAGLTLIRRRRN